MKKIYVNRIFICVLWLMSPAVCAQASDEAAQANTQEGASDGWLEGFRKGLETTVESSARWIDGFFADRGMNSEDHETYGRLTLAPQWSRYHKFEVDSRFRAQFKLPHAKEDFSAFLGQVDEGEFLDQQDVGRPSVINSPTTDDEWLVGLGFSRQVNEAHRLTYSIGVRGGIRFDTYARARYRVDSILSDKSLMRWESSVFWRDSDGYGIAQRIDTETQLTTDLVAKWSALGTFAQETQGVRWSSSAIMYLLTDKDHAYAAEIWSEGENEAPVTVVDYGIRVLDRRKIYKSWLLMETWVGHHWPREERYETRRGHWMVGVEFELRFGNERG